MPEHQADLPLDAAFNSASATTPELRDEIARVWNLSLGRRVEVFLRNGQRDTIAGVLALADAPDFPWDPRRPLRLRIAGCDFSTRDIEHWKPL